MREHITHASGDRPSADTLLDVEGLHGWYAGSHVLHGMDFKISDGEVVTLLGRNGAGKTTTMKAIMGLLAKRRGSVTFRGRQLIDKSSRAIAKSGIAYCPEERGIFSTLSVEENLMLPPQIQKGGMELSKILNLFPNVKERLASPGTKLSGGEQQMLAIARILRTGSKMLLLDEPTEGLAPVIVKQIADTITVLKKEGYTILLIEQNFHFASSIADRHYIVEQGKVVDVFPNNEVETNREKLHAYLSV